jgi:hypothetical protein
VRDAYRELRASVQCAGGRRKTNGAVDLDPALQDRAQHHASLTLLYDTTHTTRDTRHTQPGKSSPCGVWRVVCDVRRGQVWCSTS